MKKLAFLFIAVLLLVPSLNSSAGDMSDGYVDEKDVTEYLNSIKFTFLSWFTGSTKIAYERALPDIRQSAEICAGIISAGYDKYRNDPSGFSLRYGHKFFLPDKDEVSLKGFYLRPEAVYSRYFYNLMENGERALSNMLAFLGTVNVSIALSFSIRLGICF